MLGQMLNSKNFSLSVFFVAFKLLLIILILRPLQQKLMTGKHPVTMAPLVLETFTDFDENQPIKIESYILRISSVKSRIKR